MNPGSPTNRKSQKDSQSRVALFPVILSIVDNGRRPREPAHHVAFIEATLRRFCRR